MKIIKRGKLPEERVHLFTCYKCRSEIEAKEGECMVQCTQREGTSITIICPVCDSLIYKNLNHYGPG